MLRKRDFLSLADLTPVEFNEWLDYAFALKREWLAGGNAPLLQNKTLGMIFTKPSLRTRVSFEMAMRQLGGHAIYLGPEEIGLGKRESVADVARVLSRFVDGIMARVFAHSDLVTLAENSRVPVINGLSDASHPCQALGDMMTIYEHKGALKGVHVSFIGDANNVATELTFACAYSGTHMTLGCPVEYQLGPDVLAKAQWIAAQTGGSVTQINDPRTAIEAAEVIYTDTWISMGQEAEAAVKMPIFMPYQVNADLMQYARPDAIIMHCLPAHRGQEITDDVADHSNSAIWDQAENRMHAQKAILVKLLK
ncbi:MAG: ornithine carbamoyltransferase [Anaerolineae bacterium]|nr:ornithine carbamoyltransferase [Anaerolineae bacterium]